MLVKGTLVLLPASTLVLLPHQLDLRAHEWPHSHSLGCAVTTFQSFEGKANVVMIGPNTTRKPGWRPDLTRRFYFSLSSPAELKKWYGSLLAETSRHVL